MIRKHLKVFNFLETKGVNHLLNPGDDFAESPGSELYFIRDSSATRVRSKSGSEGFLSLFPLQKISGVAGGRIGRGSTLLYFLLNILVSGFKFLPTNIL